MGTHVANADGTFTGTYPLTASNYKNFEKQAPEANGWPPGGSVTITDNACHPRKRRAGDNYLWVGVMRWDTSDMPQGAQVVSAALEISPPDKTTNNARNLDSDWFNWTGLAGTDVWISGSLTTAFTKIITSISLTSVNSIPLSSAAANIVPTGMTHLRLAISGGRPDVVGDNNYVNLGGNSVLVVQYTAPYELVGMAGI